MAVPFSELQSAAPSAIIELFQLELNAAQHGVNETHYLHSGSNLNASGEIVWAGQTYLRWPIEASGFECNGQGQLPRPTLRVGNWMWTITALIETLPNGLEGAKVSRIRTLARYLDAVNFPGGVNPLGTPDSTAEFPREMFYIDRKATENIEVVEFEMCAVFDLAGVRAPKRQCISNICQWKYRGAECGYVGNAYFDANDNPVSTLAQDVCGKRLSSCEARFLQQRIAGSVTVGNNIITLAQAASFSTGDPVSGFGVPAGATVSSVAGNQVTISQPATASTTVVSGGTLQGDYRTIALASTVGIVPGMSVSGTYLGAGAQVTAVAGNTVTLGAPADLTQFFVQVGSANSRIVLYPDRFGVYFDKGTPLTIEWYATGPGMPLSRLCQIVGIKYQSQQITGFNRSSPVANYFSVATMSQVITTGQIGLWRFYVPGFISSATYTFSATNQIYTFRADNALPYGSFPGVGTFFT